MRLAPLVAVSILVLVESGCGGSTTARTAPGQGTSPASVAGATTSRSTHTSTASSAGRPASTPTAPAAPPATPTPEPTAPVTTRSAAPAAIPAPCGPADVSITTSTDMSHYAPGENVQASVVIRNLSSRSCDFAAPGQFTIAADQPPATVFMVHLECPAAGCAPLSPGQMSTYSVGWNQLDDQGHPMAPGGYHATASFSGFAPAAAPFSIG